jgi:flavodoxin
MNALVIYDSEFGNTEQIAQAIADALGSFGEAQAVSVRQATLQLAGVDLLVVGSPTWKLRPTPTMRDLLKNLPRGALRGIAVASFDTRYPNSRVMQIMGSAAQAMTGRLKQKGGKLVVPAENFFVVARQGPLADGEIQRAGRWARQIASKLSAHGA